MVFLVGCFSENERAIFDSTSAEVAWYFSDLDCTVYDDFMEFIGRTDFAKKNKGGAVVIVKPVSVESSGKNKENWCSPMQYEFPESIACVMAYCKSYDIPLFVFDNL